MNKKLIIITIFAVSILLALEGLFIFRGFEGYEREVSRYIPMPSVGQFREATPTQDINVSAEVSSPSASISPSTPLRASVLHKVPFTSQAPFGNWDNIIFQQGCEEASMLMAMLWVQGRGFISASDAEKAIVSISNFSQKNYGEFRDTSSQDTAVIMRDYFDYEKIETKTDITIEDVKRELINGNLVIVPVNGQKIGNPFYTPPGPVQHMLVIRGYDSDKKEFITNDPGTRHGEGFRYGEKTLEAALQDYITGYKEPVEKINKSMIVVAR